MVTVYVSDSVSRCFFAAPKVVHFGYTNGTRGFSLGLVTKPLEGRPCQMKLLPLDQKPKSSPGDIFWLFLPVLLFTLLGRFTCQSKAFHLSQIHTNCGPWPYQWSIGRHFHKIWKLGNTCELHGSIKQYKNVMKPQKFLKAPALGFFKYYCN